MAFMGSSIGDTEKFREAVRTGARYHDIPDEIATLVYARTVDHFAFGAYPHQAEVVDYIVQQFNLETERLAAQVRPDRFTEVECTE